MKYIFKGIFILVLTHLGPLTPPHQKKIIGSKIEGEWVAWQGWGWGFSVLPTELQGPPMGERMSRVMTSPIAGISTFEQL